VYDYKEIYFGIKTDDSRLSAHVRGTFIHEIHHFVMHEVFDNDANPYFKNDKERLLEFTDICNDLSRRKDELPRILSQAFSLYKPISYHAELIVRVPQILTEGNDLEIKKLDEKASKLLTYYRTYVLPMIEAHAHALEENLMLSTKYMNSDPLQIQFQYDGVPSINKGKATLKLVSH
jgi:hypothetical protein